MIPKLQTYAELVVTKRSYILAAGLFNMYGLLVDTKRERVNLTIVRSYAIR